MNTLWLKIAAVAIGALILVVVAANFMGGEKPTTPPPRPSTETKTVYDQFKEDDKRLNAPIPSPNQPSPPAQAQTAQQPAASGPAAAQPPSAAPGQAVAQAPVTPPQPQGQPKFKPIGEEQQVRADELWGRVLAGRKMGRLPMISYGDMVRYCRQILREYPGTEYAYKAKRALADIPDYAQRQYTVTQQELDVSGFYK